MNGIIIILFIIVSMDRHLIESLDFDQKFEEIEIES
jgi:hypothetical protein